MAIAKGEAPTDINEIKDNSETHTHGLLHQKQPWIWGLGIAAFIALLILLYMIAFQTGVPSLDSSKDKAVSERRKDISQSVPEVTMLETPKALPETPASDDGNGDSSLPITELSPEEAGANLKANEKDIILIDNPKFLNKNLGIKNLSYWQLAKVGSIFEVRAGTESNSSSALFVITTEPRVRKIYTILYDLDEVNFQDGMGFIEIDGNYFPLFYLVYGDKKLLIIQYYAYPMHPSEILKAMLNGKEMKVRIPTLNVEATFSLIGFKAALYEAFRISRKK